MKRHFDPTTFLTFKYKGMFMVIPVFRVTEKISMPYFNRVTTMDYRGNILMHSAALTTKAIEQIGRSPDYARARRNWNRAKRCPGKLVSMASVLLERKVRMAESARLRSKQLPSKIGHRDLPLDPT